MSSTNEELMCSTMLLHRIARSELLLSAGGILSLGTTVITTVLPTFHMEKFCERLRFVYQMTA